MSHSAPSMPPDRGPIDPASVPTPTETPGSVRPATGSDSSTTDVAKDRAGDVTDTARQAGGQVVGEARQQASQVAGEVRNQTRNLLHQGLSEVRSQTGQQQQRLAQTVHSWAKELGAMASASAESGPMTDLVRDASRRSGELAHWLENHEPKHIVSELRSFARRRPGTFLFAAAAAGVVAGRLTRGIAADQSDGSSHDELPAASTTPALPQGSGASTAPVPGPTPAATSAARPSEPTGRGSTGTGSSGIGAAEAGTGPLDVPPAGPAAGTATGTGLGSEIGGPGSAGPGVGPGGVGPGVSGSSPSGAVPPEVVEPPQSSPPASER